MQLKFTPNVTAISILCYIVFVEPRGQQINCGKGYIMQRKGYIQYLSGFKLREFYNMQVAILLWQGVK